jgi:transcriptional regulator with XRE-family HTH domain
MAVMQGDDRVAAGLIREIRRESGLSQAELARRASLPRSVVNAYEHGAREPGVEALARIASAAGLEVRVERPSNWSELARAGRILEQVLDLAEVLPGRRKGRLDYPPLSRLAA